MLPSIAPFGVATPYEIAQAGLPPTATSVGGTVTSVGGHSFPPEYRPADGFHTTTAAPHLKSTTTQPVALSRHTTTPILQLATLDGPIVAAALTSAGMAAKRLFCIFRL